MTENSNIEWTDHTFNPWIGCTKISPACDHCYAETWDNRFNGTRWGPHAVRTRTSAAYWKGPLKWDRKAAADGVRRRVFCASLADVFDNHKSIEPRWRDDLWNLIDATPNLDWLLLTKRPQNVEKYVRWWLGPHSWPRNVWFGTTVENQEEADRRIPHLLSLPAKVHFLSCEPLLGPINLRDVNGSTYWPGFDALREKQTRVGPGGYGKETIEGPRIDWVICGGESGPNARPMHPDWARSLRDQCAAAGVAFFYKQNGEWAPPRVMEFDHDAQCTFQMKAQRDPSLVHIFDDGTNMGRIGKKAAGRWLDGVEHNGLPEARK